jgi:hypothetical protein
MKDVNYYLDKASKMGVGEEMAVNVVFDDGGWVKRTGYNTFECYESAGHDSNKRDHGVHTIDTLKDFMNEYNDITNRINNTIKL